MATPAGRLAGADAGGVTPAGADAAIGKLVGSAQVKPHHMAAVAVKASIVDSRRDMVIYFSAPSDLAIFR
jgi:hypothetical protein